MVRRKGWHGESRRHSLARKGIKTGQKLSPRVKSMLKKKINNDSKRILFNDNNFIIIGDEKKINANIIYRKNKPSLFELKILERIAKNEGYKNITISKKM